MMSEYDSNFVLKQFCDMDSRTGPQNYVGLRVVEPPSRFLTLKPSFEVNDSNSQIYSDLTFGKYHKKSQNVSVDF